MHDRDWETQDKMFIRFSDQEDISDYTPTSINTAGTFRLDSGTTTVGSNLSNRESKRWSYKLHYISSIIC